MDYILTTNKKIKEYFNVLEPEYPIWLNDYINTDELLKQQYISVTCGTIYSDLFQSSFFFSSLDHAIAVALIIWHFTHDKKQTLSGLFHDIATPVFKHCVDFLNEDYMTQESTEDLTTKMIENSKEIMQLLRRDKIELTEIDDYHKYSIADNDTPQLSADRLEYSLSNALLTYELTNIDNITKIYNDIKIEENEKGINELSFNTKSIAVEFTKLTSKLSLIYMEDRTRYSMQLLADIIKRLNNETIICSEDLYRLKESDIIKIIEKSKYNNVFKIWKNAKKINISKTEPIGVYSVCHGTKIRYIDPLVNQKRVSQISKISKNRIDKNLSYDMTNYVYLDFKI